MGSFFCCRRVVNPLDVVKSLERDHLAFGSGVVHGIFESAATAARRADKVGSGQVRHVPMAKLEEVVRHQGAPHVVVRADEITMGFGQEAVDDDEGDVALAQFLEMGSRSLRRHSDGRSRRRRGVRRAAGNP